MDKAIEVRSEFGVFLVETDVSIVVPATVVSAGGPSRGTTGRLPDGMQAVSAVSDVERNFSEVRDLIVTFCKGLDDAIARIPSPERVSVEFGVKFGGEFGVPMVTKASGEASLKITIEWKPGTPSRPAT